MLTLVHSTCGLEMSFSKQLQKFKSFKGLGDLGEDHNVLCELKQFNHTFWSFEWFLSLLQLVKPLDVNINVGDNISGEIVL